MPMSAGSTSRTPTTRRTMTGDDDDDALATEHEKGQGKDAPCSKWCLRDAHAQSMAVLNTGSSYN